MAQKSSSIIFQFFLLALGRRVGGHIFQRTVFKCKAQGAVGAFYLCGHNLGRKGLKAKANLQRYIFTVATTHSVVSPHRTFQLLKYCFRLAELSSLSLRPLRLRTHAGTVTIASPSPLRAAAWGEALPDTHSGSTEGRCQVHMPVTCTA